MDVAVDIESPAILDPENGTLIKLSYHKENKSVQWFYAVVDERNNILNQVSPLDPGVVHIAEKLAEFRLAVEQTLN